MRSCMFVAVAAILFTPARAPAQEGHHDHFHGGAHSHRGPGPHFIDAFFTENAFLERKLRPDVFFSSGDNGKGYTAQLEVEWAFLPRFSAIVHAPFHHVAPNGLPSESGIGDIGIGAKAALVDDQSAFILALGADLELPTGDENRGLGEEHAAIAPFLLGWLPFGPERRWLLQTSAHADIPLEADPESHVELSAALSWTSPLGISPILEGLVEFEVQGGPASWALAPGFRFEFAPAWELGGAVRFPVSGPREEDVRIAAGVIRHFPLPR